MQQIPQQQLIVVREPKSTGIAYVLWFFLGGLGVHRFYLNRVGSGVGILALSLVGWSTVWLFVGILPLMAWFVWLIVDLFLIPDMVREENSRQSVPVGYVAVPQMVSNYGYVGEQRAAAPPVAEAPFVRLASVSEVVDLSIIEALSSAQLFLTRQGYEVVGRTDHSLKARRLQQYLQTSPGQTHSVVEILVHPQVGSGVRIDIVGSRSDPIFKEQRAEWSSWADGLPKQRLLPAIGDTTSEN